ncbi:MAG: methionine adenosyltransferase [Planctomycetota bacterium]|jgi:S-adenosylmethionine synthetase
MRYTFTSESVTEGHPDKACDLIADSILDACLEQDPTSRVAMEAMCKSEHVILAGEITSHARVNHEEIAREAIRGIGYTDPEEAFHADGVCIQSFITRQSPEIKAGVDQQGAGDQGLMFGYATDETPQLMPLPILLAHRLAQQLAEDRKAGRVDWLKPDGKTQVSVEYDGGRPQRVTDVLVSAQHGQGVDQGAILQYVRSDLMPRALAEWTSRDINVIANPTGSFVAGGPSTDSGLSGRKNIVDTYGGMARHGGGSFSGKDPTKVDRSGTYFCRYVARQIVITGIARRAEVHVSYAIGRADPVSICVETFGTGDPSEATRYVTRNFDFRPAAIIQRLDLLRPIYRSTTNYGHFGRPGLPWEK